MEEMLHRWNPWWEEGKVPPDRLGTARPRYLGALTAQLRERRVTVVSGPRRTGKTTLVFQTINALIDAGTSPDRILYAQLDHPGIDMDIGAIIREFRKLQGIPAKERIFIFLDEVQYAKDWARWAKTIFDMDEGKLFITGSTTALLETDAFASLTGRWTKIPVWPLDLEEFILFRNGKVTGADRYLESSHLREYMRTGGFPEAVLEKEEHARTDFLVDLFDDMIFKDAARSRNIRDPDSLRQVAVFLMGAVGKPGSVNKMQRTFKLSANTISSYIDALCNAYLFFPCPYFSRSVNERIYNPRKYYAIDPGMAHAVLGHQGSGAAVENLLALHYHKSGPVSYWKSEAELDFVIGNARGVLESKFKGSIDPKELRGGLSFCKRHRLKRLFVATDDLEEERDIAGIDVLFVPATRILLGKGGP
jgi:hypothetical protein